MTQDVSTSIVHYSHFAAEPRKVKAIVIGAGISGIAFTYKAKQIENLEFQIYEKNPEPTGTWYENRYPGCACDIPAHSYTYSWVGNPDWKKFYAGRPEIYAFYTKLAKEYEVEKYTKFETQVIGAKWVHSLGQWEVTVKDLNTGVETIDRGEFLINLGGVLNNWKWPDLKGLEKFKGVKIHTARWAAEDSDLKDKRVAVIGSGASAIQLVPQVQPLATKLFSFNRSPNWIVAEFASDLAKDGRETIFTEEEIQRFHDDPEHFLQFREDVEHSVNSNFELIYQDSQLQKDTTAAVTASMKSKLKNDPKLCQALIPDFPVGCRRVTPGNNYLETLIKENVQVITNGIKEVTETGIVTNDDKLIEVDVIVTATGFDTSFCPRFPIIGSDGKDLREKWANNKAAAYLSVTAPHLPNYFMTGGPNSPISNGSLIPGFEKQIEFALSFIKKVQTQSIKSVQVKQRPTDDFNAYKNEFMLRTSWAGGCTSWYKNGKEGTNVLGPWPGSGPEFMEIMSQPRYEDFEYEYLYENSFEYLGNGQSMREKRGTSLGWYVRDGATN